MNEDEWAALVRRLAMVDALDSEALVLVVCPACQRGGSFRDQDRGGVVAKVERTSLDGRIVSTHAFALRFKSTARGQRQAPPVAVKLPDRWAGVSPATPEGETVDSLVVSCGHGVRGVPVATLDAALARPRRKGRPTIILSEPPTR